MLADRVRMAAGNTDVQITLDGTHTTADSGAGTTQHTHNSVTAAGPVSVLFVTHRDAGNVDQVSATWDGQAMTQLVHRRNSVEAGPFCSCAIYIIDGAMSGNVVINYAETVDQSAVTAASLRNLESLTAIDTDGENTASGNAKLDALLTPGDGGIRLALFANATAATAATWTNATELTDFASGNHRHSVAYALGDSASTITPDSAGGIEVVVGVSLR